jgi:hypothetical protein
MLAYTITAVAISITNLAKRVQSIRDSSNYCSHDEPISPIPTGRGRRWLPGMLWIRGVVLLTGRRTGGSAGIRRVRSWGCAAACSSQRDVNFFLSQVLASKERNAVFDGG